MKQTVKRYESRNLQSQTNLKYNWENYVYKPTEGQIYTDPVLF